MKQCSIGCVVMASGFSHRYGSNKLIEPVDGVALYQRVLNAIPADVFAKVVVVTRFDEIAAYAQKMGFTTVYNNHPEYGQSNSIHLGLSQTNTYDATVFFVCDQPYLEKYSIEKLVDLYHANPDCICRFSCNGNHGNPCLFPAKFYSELMEITGDRGGNKVIKQHQSEVKLLEVSEKQLMDIDTKESN